MKVIDVPGVMQQRMRALREEGATIGFVPTMGCFHEGHLSLMRAARVDDVVAVSIFVNPTQFGPGEDFESYPRDLARDLAAAAAAGVDYLFAPTAAQMYPPPHLTQVQVKGVTEGMCGASRPGHFDGVATVVAKLFHIIMPTRAYFGRKDAQQLAVIAKMVDDLNFEVEIVSCETVREPDGLAMSSRNAYLGPEERRAATVLYRAVKEARRLVDGGETDVVRIETAMRDVIESEPLVQLEYGVLCDTLLMPIAKVEGQMLVAVAARVGGTRLIDNILIKVER
ncbi:MAG: pantoate--beta-alanine ligase [Candidatus Geothermincolia bacterium]